MAKRNPKEIILFAALKLISNDGYDGVTIWDTAEEVGIMQSSLYKHYASKQEIFDTLVAKMEQYYADALQDFELPAGKLGPVAKEYATRGDAVLKQISTSIFLFNLKDEHASQFRRLLSIEKYKSQEIDAIYRKVCFDSILSYQSKLFAEMIKQGYMKQIDPYIMAMQFYSPIFLLLNKYDGIPEKEQEALDLLGKHIEQFDILHRKDNVK